MKVNQSQFEMIKTEAYSLGFCLAGSIHTGRPRHFDEYKTWLSRNEFGDMTYLARQDAIEKRSDPTLFLSSGKSFLVLGFPYPAPEPPVNENKGVGQIASYALMPDYHIFVKQKMQELIPIIQRILKRDFAHREFVDSSPIMEKDIAEAAGLGWMGKNSCLISPQLGSFFLLSEILTDLEFESDPPIITDRCGNCTRCIDACPTHCIRADRTLVANHCISYLTIEHKGIIPNDLRASMRNKVFGCDVCQVICPWNKKALQTHLVKKNTIEKLISQEVNLSSEIFLDESQFTERYCEYPVFHIKRNRYLRNIVVAIGNQKSEENFEILEKAIHLEKDPLIRAHLYWAVGETKSKKSSSLLENFSRSETDPQCLREIIEQLKKDRASY